MERIRWSDPGYCRIARPCVIRSRKAAVPRHVRIVLIQENRYQALLIRREVHARLMHTVIAVFHNPIDATHELSRTAYDLAIVDTAISAVPAGQLLQHIRRIDPTLPVVALVDDNREASAGMRADDRHLYVIGKSDSYVRLLPDMILRHRRRTSPDDTAEAELAGALTESTLDNIASLENDINNPLMNILGATELLLSREEPLEPDVAAKLRVIRGSAQRIRRVVQQLSRPPHHKADRAAPAIDG
ncbi:hypothetical protein GF420_00660 [candidate division GN15 bacterium]|nr:hypothetical protein [candidate division GN15 bacterium]